MIKIQLTKKRIILRWENPCICWLWLFVGYENQYSFFFIYLFIEIHNLSNLDIWWNFLTVRLACWWLPPAGYHPRVCYVMSFIRSAGFQFRLLSMFMVLYVSAASRFGCVAILDLYFSEYLLISSFVRSWVPRRADVCPVPCKVHKTARDHPVAAECRDVQTCVQCPVKFTKLHVTPICRKRIQLT